MRNYRKILSTIAYKEEWSIRAFVAKEALCRDYADIKHFFKDLFRYWCISWMVNSLIRYTDTHRFFDEHYDEIQEVLEEQEEIWLDFKWNGSDLKNQLAWLSFEHVAWNIANIDLRLEI